MQDLTKAERIMIQRSRRRKERKYIEFSKKIIFSVLLVTYIIIAFTMFIVYITRDTSPLQYLLPGMFALTTVAVGFYANKAKAENIQKIKNNKENCNIEDIDNFANMQ